MQKLCWLEKFSTSFSCTSIAPRTGGFTQTVLGHHSVDVIWNSMDIIQCLFNHTVELHVKTLLGEILLFRLVFLTIFSLWLLYKGTSIYRTIFHAGHYMEMRSYY